MYNLETAAAATAGMGGISINPDGTADAFYAKKKAWHGLGDFEEASLPFDKVVEKYLKFEVEKRQHVVNMGTAENPKYMPIASHGIYRTDFQDERAFLGAVGARYEPFQNWQLLELGALACEHAGQAKFSSAFSLYGGQVVCATIDLNDSIEVKGDVTHPYLVLMTSHNGSTPVSLGVMTFRPDCQNMVAHAYRTLVTEEEQGLAVRLRHTTFLAEKIETVKKMVAANKSFIGGLKEKFAVLSEKRIQPSQKVVETVLDKVYRLTARTKKDSEGVELTGQAQRVMEQISSIFWDNQNGLPTEIKHTAFGLWQSITYFENHAKNPRVTAGADKHGYDAQDLRQIGMLLPNKSGFTGANEAFRVLTQLAA